MTDVAGRIIVMQDLCKIRLNYPLSESPSSSNLLSPLPSGFLLFSPFLLIYCFEMGTDYVA